MESSNALRSLVTDAGPAATAVVEAAANALVQSTAALLVGLVTARLLRRRGAAVQSAVLRATLVAVVACPLASWLLGAAGLSGFRLHLPMPDTSVAAAVPASTGTLNSAAPTSSDRVVEGDAATGAFAGEEPWTRLPSRPAGFAGSAADTATNAMQPEAAHPAEPAAIADPVNQVLTAAPAPPLAKRTVAYFTLAALWLSVCTFLLLRLLAAVFLLRAARGGAGLASPEELALCAKLADAMGVAPPPAVLVTPRVDSPCLVGCWRPAILLPGFAGAGGRAGVARDVLVHELAHLKRRDCAWLLLGRLAVAALWFQPLVWALMRRLDRAADEVCDDHVVARVGDRAAYAGRLVDLAERHQWRWPSDAGAAVGVVTFRSAVAQRVQRILDTSRALSTRVGRLTAVMVLGVGLGATLLAGLLGVARDAEAGAGAADTPAAEGATAQAAPAAAPAAASKPVPPEVAPPPANDGDADVIRVRGRVLGPDDKPVAGASVTVPSPNMWDEEVTSVSPVARATSGRDGTFEIAFRKSQLPPFSLGKGKSGADEWRRAQVVASADGFGLAWARWERGDPGGELVLKLAPDDVPIEGRLVTLEGQPVAGVSVSVNFLRPLDQEAIAEAFRNDPDNMGDVELQYPFGAAGRAPTVTDADGRFRITGMGRDRFALLKLTGPGVGVARIEVATRDMPAETRQVPNGIGGFDKHVTYGARFDHAMGPVRTVRGTVRDAATGRPIVGVIVRSLQFAGQNYDHGSGLTAVTGEQGQYQLDGFPKGDGNRLIVVPTDAQPYFMREAEVPDEPGLAPVALDVELHKGVWVTGKVTDKATGRPVAATLTYSTYLDNERTHELPEFQRVGGAGMRDGFWGRYETHPDGTYRLVAVPGKAIVGAHCTQSKSYRVGVGFDQIRVYQQKDGPQLQLYQPKPSPQLDHAVKEIDVPAGAEQVTCDLQVESGETIRLAITDPDGKPAGRQLSARGRAPMDDFNQVTGPAFEAIGVSPDEERVVAIIDEDRKLGRVVRIRIADLPEKRLTIQLQPMAEVSGRLLTPDGDPMADTRILARVSGASWVRAFETDSDGEFRTTLPARVAYSLDVSRGPYDGSVVKKLTLKPGETIELGDVELGGAVPDAAAPDIKPEAEAADAPADPEEVPAATDVIRVRGRVLGPDGNPVAGASVTVPSTETWDERLFRTPVAKAASGPDGTFEIAFRKSQLAPFSLGAGQSGGDRWRQAQVVASADGMGLAWARWDRAGASGELVLRLVPDDVPIEGRVLNLEGQPVAGVRVTVDMLAPLDEAVIKEAYQKNPEDPGDLMLGTPLLSAGRAEPGVTAADGRFRITGIGRDRRVFLRVSGPAVGYARIEAATRDMPPVTRVVPQPIGTEDKFVTYGAKFDYLATPGRSVRGTITDAATGEPMAGVVVQSYRFAGPFQGFDPQGLLTTVTDAKGRYQLEGFPKGNQVLVTPTDEQPYFMRELKVPDEPGLAPVTVDVALHKGIWITGKVTDKATGRPVSARLNYTTYLTNEHTQGLPFFRRTGGTGHKEGMQGRWETKPDGTYRLVAAPGKAVVSVWCIQPGYRHGVGFDEVPALKERRDVISRLYQSFPNPDSDNLVKEVDVPADAERVTCDFELDPGETIHVAVTNPDGNPAAGPLLVRGMEAEDWGGVHFKMAAKPAFDATAFGPEDERTIYVLDDSRKLGRALRVKLADAPDRRLTVQLQPTAQVRGRLLNADGDPLAEVRIEASESRGDGRAVRIVATDAEGRFETTLPAGLKYYMMVDRGAHVGALVANDLEPQPGGDIDLGDVNLGAGPDAAAPDVKPEAEDAAPAADAAAAPAPAPAAADDVIRVRGRVLGPDGKPVAAAAVTVASTPTWNTNEIPTRTPVARATSGPDGAFEIAFRKSQVSPFSIGFGNSGAVQWRQTQVVALAEGFGLAWGRWDRVGADGELVLKLVPAGDPIEGRVLNLEGQPVAGVRVAVEQLAPLDEVAFEEAWRKDSEAAADLRLAYPLAAAGRAAGPVVTGADGRFRLTGLGQNRRAFLTLTGPAVGFVRAEVATRDMPAKMREIPNGIQGFDRHVTYGAKFDHVVPPVRSVRGTVTDAATGKPMAGVVVRSLSFGNVNHGPGVLTSVTDENGRYQLDGFPKGDGNRLLVVPTDAQPYFMREAEVPDEPGLAPVALDVELHKGVWVTGKVTDKATGRPVSAAVDYTTYIANEHTHKLPEFRRSGGGGSQDGGQNRYETRPDGTYRVVAAPGKAIVAATARQQAYRTGLGFDQIPVFPKDGRTPSTELYHSIPSPRRDHAAKEINVPADAEQVTCDFELDPGETIRVAVTDPDGNPAARKLTARGQSKENFGGAYFRVVSGPAFDAISFAPDEERVLTVLDDERKLGRVVRVKVADLPGRKLTLQLQPTAEVTGRLLTPDGDPLGDTHIEARVLNGGAVRLIQTDADGRFNLTLPVGITYNLDVRFGPHDGSSVRQDLTPEPGAKIDLGEVKFIPWGS